MIGSFGKEEQERKFWKKTGNRSRREYGEKKGRLGKEVLEHLGKGAG
jgi:hypothetical protein